MNALRGMSLFEAHPPILFQPFVNLLFPGIQFRNRIFFDPVTAVEIVYAHVLRHGFAVDVQPLGDLLGPYALSLQFFDLINLVHSKHVSSLQDILQGFPVDFPSRFLRGILTIFLSMPK